MLQLWIIYVISGLFLLCFRVRLFIDALWSPAGKGLTSWPSFVKSNNCYVPIGILGQVRLVLSPTLASCRDRSSINQTGRFEICPFHGMSRS